MAGDHAFLGALSGLLIALALGACDRAPSADSPFLRCIPSGCFSSIVEK